MFEPGNLESVDPDLRLANTFTLLDNISWTTRQEHMLLSVTGFNVFTHIRTVCRLCWNPHIRVLAPIFHSLPSVCSSATQWKLQLVSSASSQFGSLPPCCCLLPPLILWWMPSVISRTSPTLGTQIWTLEDSGLLSRLSIARLACPTCHRLLRLITQLLVHQHSENSWSLIAWILKRSSSFLLFRFAQLKH